MLTTAWKTALAARGSRKVILVTIVPSSVGRLDTLEYHPAKGPGVYRFATDTAHPTSGTKSYPFLPYISDWPELSWDVSLTERRATIPNTRISIIRNDDTEALQEDLVSAQTAIVRIDLWTDDISIDDAIPLMIGTVEGVDFDEATGRITFTVRDGDPKRDVEFPGVGQKLNRQDFPQIHEAVANYASRQFILGPFPYGVGAAQIDKFGSEFYLCDGRLTSAPTDFYAGGQRMTKNAPTVVTARFASDPAREYTKLVFRKPLQDALYYGSVIAANGVGVDPQNPLVSLIRDFGQYGMTGEAAAKISRLPFDFSILMNAQASIKAIVFDRLLPQTQLIGCWRNGRVDVYDPFGESPTWKLSKPGRLLDRLERGGRETEGTNVFNVIEVAYSRRWDLSQLFYAPNSITLDKESSTIAGKRCAASEAQYGRRYLKVDANDLYSTGDAERLAEYISEYSCFTHKQYTYMVDWTTGIGIDVCHRAKISDSGVGLADTEAIVTRKTIHPAGVFIDVQTLPEV